MKADRVILGLAVIAVGLIWLFNSAGFFTLPMIRDIWRFWPVLLIIWGLLLLFGKGGSGSTGCLLAIVIILLAGAALCTSFFNYDGTEKKHVFDIGNNYAVEKVYLDARQHGGEFLLAPHTGEQMARLELRTAPDPEVTHKISGNTLKIVMAEKSGRLFRNNGSDWKLYLRKDLPAEITLNTGATDALFDMTELQVKRLNINTGAGNLTLKLGRVDGTISIKGGAGDITVYIPENVGVRLQAKGALLNVDSGDGRMAGIGTRRYESGDLAAKDAIIELNVKIAVGSIKLKRS